jgi:sulfur relay (sulfurtransferase) DsrF/TusC family protein
MGMWIIHNAELVAKQLGLPKNSLDATLIIAYQNREDNIRVHMYGDGCIIEFFETSGYKFHQIDYSKNAPYYLSYKIDPERHKLFEEMGQEKIIKTWFQNVGWETNVEKVNYDTNSVFNFDLNYMDNYSKMKGLLLTSDGFISFIEKGQPEPLNILDYTPDFYMFKTTKGEFLKRRATVAIKQLAKENIHNYDDLSIGVFLKGDDE